MNMKVRKCPFLTLKVGNFFKYLSHEIDTESQYAGANSQVGGGVWGEGLEHVFNFRRTFTRQVSS